MIEGMKNSIGLRIIEYVSHITVTCVCSTVFSRIMPNFGLQRSRIKQVPLYVPHTLAFCQLKSTIGVN